MAAINYNFSIEKGSSFEIEFNYLDSNNNTIDLTNWCAMFQMIDDANNLYVVSNREYNNQYRLTTSNDGKIILQFSSNFTNILNFNSANYDLDLQEPNEQYTGSGYKTYRISSGNITLIPRNTTLQLNNCNIFLEDPDCPSSCISNDIFSKQYTGSGFTINDNTINTSIPINILDTNNIQNISVSINGLSHTNPQDLIFILSPPSGDSILLAANQKISNYRPNFSFTLSDDINLQSTLNNVINNGLCKIVDKTTYIKYSNNLSSNFNHLVSTSPSGNWYLNIIDTDSGGPGQILSWRINILYEDEEI